MPLNKIIGDREIIERFTKIEMTLVDLCQKIDASLANQEMLAKRIRVLEKAKLIYTGSILGGATIITLIYHLLTFDIIGVIKRYL